MTTYTIENYNQDQLVSIAKDALVAYNANVDIVSTGTYWDLVSNVIAAVAKEAVDRGVQIGEASVPENATADLLEAWTQSLGIPNRKVGTYAQGSVAIVSTSYPVTIPIGTSFSLVGLEYTATSETTLNQAGTINVQAVVIGAEYNITIEKTLTNSLGVTATSQGIYGGTGAETDAELLARILLNIQYRKTEGMLTDYLQRALNIYPRASAETVFVEDVIPYGVALDITNTVFDFEVAAANPFINEIGLDAAQLTTVSNTLQNYSTVTAQVEVTTTETQSVDSIMCYVYTSSNTLTAEQAQECREAIRIALMQFQGETLSYASLYPTLPSYVTSYFFQYFIPIARTSPMMDSVNIGVALANESTIGALEGYSGGVINNG